jgi:hypothetical protein
MSRREDQQRGVRHSAQVNGTCDVLLLPSICSASSHLHFDKPCRAHVLSASATLLPLCQPALGHVQYLRGWLAYSPITFRAAVNCSMRASLHPACCNCAHAAYHCCAWPRSLLQRALPNGPRPMCPRPPGIEPYSMGMSPASACHDQLSAVINKSQHQELASRFPLQKKTEKG